MNQILLSHGSGGQLTHSLIKEFVGVLGNKFLNQLDDSAVFKLKKSIVAFTTDSYVVSPIFFPGGDIGRLAVCGTVNDLAVCGAKPLFLSSSVIIEEGFPKDKLWRILDSMGKTAKEAGVKIVTGDTKVVERGACDQIFITTSGLGIVDKRCELSLRRVKPGDRVLISGTIGDHGFSILNAREDFDFKSTLKSDVAPLNSLIGSLMPAGKDIRFMRDPTRGGLATTLNEIVEHTRIGMEIEEDLLPIRSKISAMGEILGMDPLYMGNEGKVVLIVSEKHSNEILRRLQAHKFGQEAAIIGIITKENKGEVVLKTGSGAKRIIRMLVGEQLPRIC